MDFVYIEDVARSNNLALMSDATDDVFNVASGIEARLQVLAEAVLRVMKSDLKPGYGPRRKFSPVSRRLSDFEKAKKQLGFEATVVLDDGLQCLVSRWQAYRDRSVS